MEKLNLEEAVAALCRVCLKSSSKLYSLFSRHNSELTIASMLEYCTSLEVTSDNSFPNGICMSCLQETKVAYNLIHNFKESHSLLEQQKTERENTVEDSSCDVQENYFMHNDILNNGEVNFLEDMVPSNLIGNTELPSVEECNTNSFSNFNHNVIEIVYDDPNLDEKNEQIKDITEVMLEKKTKKSKRRKKVNKKVIKESETTKDIDEEIDNLDIKHICPVLSCSTSFLSYNKFDLHLRRQHSSMTVNCTRCPFVPDSLLQYLVHYKEHHRFQCKICNKSYQTNYGFKYHMKIHNNERKTFVCHHEKCGKSFLVHHSLKRHLLKHATVKNILCSKCGERFKTYDMYRYHMKTHDGSRNHLCTTCGKTFLQAVHLRDHISSTHSAEPKAYKCSSCTAAYTTLYGLNRHCWKYDHVEEPKKSNELVNYINDSESMVLQS